MNVVPEENKLQIMCATSEDYCGDGDYDDDHDDGDGDSDGDDRYDHDYEAYYGHQHGAFLTFRPKILHRKIVENSRARSSHEVVS